MQTARVTGQGASVLKYDILTALSLIGLHGSPGMQTSMFRLSALITARYNWRLDQLTVGQADMARMWGVDPRTVKREIKRLTEARILVCTRAGVKGRVAGYRLNLPRIFELSEPKWGEIGSDYADRMAGQSPLRDQTVVQVDFKKADVPVPVDAGAPGTWGAVAARIARLHPDIHRNWIRSLEFLGETAGRYRLRAPSAFVARYVDTHLQGIVMEAVEVEVGPGRRIEVSTG